MKLILSNQIAPEVEPHLPSDLQVVHVDEHGHLDGDARDAEVYLYWWTSNPIIDKVLEAATSLRWLQVPNAGVERVLTPTLQKRDIILTNGAGVHAIPMAEFVLAFMLNHAKSMKFLHAAQAERQWNKRFGADNSLLMQELMDATLLIIGLGNIGQAIAQRAMPFGMRIWGSRRHPQPLPGIERVVGASEWRSLLRDADYVVIATPLTPDTRGLFDAAALRSMHPNAYLINIARGEIVDEAALVTALREGWIAGAALDAFIKEPLPPDSPFWSLPNVFVTPHFTGNSPRMRQRVVELFLENLASYRAGKPLRNVVDKNTGY